MHVAVIGGTRGLGYWIANFLKDNGFDVTITGRNQVMGEASARKIGVAYSYSNIKTSSQADIIILAVPMEVMSDVILEVSPYLKKGSLLVDVGSIKEEPAEIMQKNVPNGVEFLPCHPMFGPRVRSLEGQVVVLTPLIKGSWYGRVVNFLESHKARVIEATPQLHDQMMSVVQGLTHFTYISIAATLKELGVDVKESRKFSSPIYSLMLDMIARIVAQNPYLCYSIQTRNRYIPQVHEQFISTYNQLKYMISQKNPDEFVKAMSSAAKHLNDLEAALGRSDKAISALNQEITLLKNSLGEEVGVRHIYSGKIHIGVLSDLTPDHLILVQDKKELRLKLSNVEVLDADFINKWKSENLPQKEYAVSAIFPESSDAHVISQIIGLMPDVIKVMFYDKYQGEQIPEGMVSFTWKYWVLDPEARYEVERILKAFGGKIR